MTIATIQVLRKRLPAFKEFLAARGAEVLEPTNEWEVVRFRAGSATAIVYTNAKGELTADGVARAALNAFDSKGPWTAGVATPRKKSAKRNPVEVRALLARDGDSCFLCRKPLGEDITIEHLVPVTCGGPHHIANKALAHTACNHQLGHLSVMEKIAMRERSGT